jgi:hypothetical protein
VAGGIGCDFEETCLYEKIPYSACFVDVNLDKVTSFSAAKFPSSSCILSNKGFFDDEIRFGKNAELRAECLFCRGQEV